MHQELLLFDVAITNSYILSTFTPTSMSISQQRLKQYRMKLAEQLVGSYNSRKRLGHPSSTTVSTPPISSQPPPPPAPPPVCGPQKPHTLHQTSRLQRRKKCVYCAEKRVPTQRKDTQLYCRDCSTHPPLCRGLNRDCFTLWHQQQL